MEQYDARIDAYIEKAADFAKPILTYLRDVAHEASPLLNETMKWSSPFFDYKGPVCQMAAFKEHCVFGFWKEKLLSDPGNHLSIGDGAGGSMGRIKTLADLPPKEALIDFIQQAIKLNESGVKIEAKKPAAAKAEVVTPDYFIAVLEQNPLAKTTFDNFSPSHRKEYVQWITEAKTEATRDKRMQTAIEWLTEGKSRNWKYQNC